MANGEGGLQRLDLNLHPNEASGLVTTENEALLEAHYRFFYGTYEDESVHLRLTRLLVD